MRREGVRKEMIRERFEREEIVVREINTGEKKSERVSKTVR